jgi:hypothetical protein
MWVAVKSDPAKHDHRNFAFCLDLILLVGGGHDEVVISGAQGDALHTQVVF